MSRLRKRKRPVSAEEKPAGQAEPKKLKKEQIMTIVIAVIMVSSVGGFLYLGGETQQANYDGHKFTLKNNKWVLKDKTLPTPPEFNYLPEQLADVPIDPAISSAIKGAQATIITYDFNDTYAEAIAAAQFGLQSFLVEDMKIYSLSAFTVKNPYNITIASCNNATQVMPVIYLKHSLETNSTKIYKEQNCIILQGFRAEDLNMLKDRLIYSLLGII